MYSTVSVSNFCSATFYFSEILREMILTFQNECIQIIVPVLVQAHNNFQESRLPGMNLVVSCDTAWLGYLLRLCG